ncbi:DUF4231 domain-containing protein [Streptomyces griseoruber]|uniref:DUF4231 domain-containing protein n=2 Tax=Streptomyces griseoruber TaxID=1943 RepID=A0A101SLL2_9ACTN|nr:DUF4231 domain-containing protein [Streptomyces griseoruber]KUN76038.1 hypothetical protein AQJ64_39770 [Streptomyces griseoruber]
MAAGTTPAPSTMLKDGDLPPLFRQSDQWALRHQSESFKGVRTHLVVLLLATAAALLTEQASGHLMAALAAVLYGVTILLGLVTSRRRSRTHWQAHRAAAELVKTLAWQYMVHGGSFHSGVADPDAVFAERLEERLRELRTCGWEDSREEAREFGTGQITPQMRAVRAKSYAARRDIYLRDRLLEQTVWYKNRAVRSRRAAARWSAFTAALTLLALTAALLGTTGLLGGADLAGLLSAAAAAGVAWQEVRRHGPLTYAHTLIEQDLEAARVAMSTTVTEAGWADAVGETERLMSPAHTEWLVRFGG